jgi:hypothetical protein
MAQNNAIGCASTDISAFNHCHHQTWTEIGIAKGEQKNNREAKKPKKEKIKTIAAAPSQKTGAGSSALGSGKKK